MINHIGSLSLGKMYLVVFSSIATEVGITHMVIHHIQTTSINMKSSKTCFPNLRRIIWSNVYVSTGMLMCEIDDIVIFNPETNHKNTFTNEAMKVNYSMKNNTPIPRAIGDNNWHRPFFISTIVI